MSRKLAGAWFLLLGGTLALLLAEKTFKTEAGAWISFWPEAVSLVLLVAVVSLPLLVAAAVLDFRASRKLSVRGKAEDRT